MAKGKTGKVIELTLSTKKKNEGVSEIINDIFMNIGIKREELVECEQPDMVSVSAYISSRQQAKQLEKKIRDLHLKKVSLQIRPLESRDWQDVWKDNFHIFALTKHIDVVPFWERKNYKQGRRVPVYIDTVLAFGTGLHETTKFMSEFVEDGCSRFENFLDVGTGTGILAIIALKHGAKDVLAIDISRSAINVARKNLFVNKCQAQLKATDIMKFKTKRKFDFVAANLITDELIRSKRKLVSLVKPQKYLAISGIARKNYPLLRDEFKKLPLRCLKVKRGRIWTAILFKRI